MIQGIGMWGNRAAGSPSHEANTLMGCSQGLGRLSSYGLGLKFLPSPTEAQAHRIWELELNLRVLKKKKRKKNTYKMRIAAGTYSKELQALHCFYDSG
jgi:hypothetical protein